MVFLAPLLSSVVAFFAAFMTQRVAVGAALGAFFVAGWVAFQASLYALWVSIDFAIPSALLAPFGVVAYLLPSNLQLCVTVLVAAKIARWLWDAQREWATAVASA